jgi:hypothetical protein
MISCNCWTLLLGYLKYLLNFNFEYVYIVFYPLNWLFWCSFFMWNLTGTDTDVNFYLWVWVRMWISTRNLFSDGWIIALPNPNSDSLSSLISGSHSYVKRVRVATESGGSGKTHKVTIIAPVIHPLSGSQAVLQYILIFYFLLIQFSVANISNMYYLTYTYRFM